MRDRSRLPDFADELTQNLRVIKNDKSRKYQIDVDMSHVTRGSVQRSECQRSSSFIRL